MRLPKAYLYGTHYFRPPNPPRGDHCHHLTRIRKELGFDMIRIRMQWNVIHRKPEWFDWAEYDEIADICQRLELGFFLETSLESAPYWLERSHPEARYVSANGQAMELGPYDATQFGGYPGLCFHHPAVIQEGGRFLRELAGHFRGCTTLLGYDCWNEPHLEPAWVCNYWGNMGDRLFCYCRGSRQAFREWLVRRYGDVEVLNETWGRAYGDWEDVNPPNRHGTYADWLDWGRFWFEWLAGHMTWRYEHIKAVDPDRFVMSHSGAVPPFLARPNAFIHNWKLARPVDLWGTSFAPKYHNWDLGTCAGTMDATRSSARGKPFWIAEMSGGATYLARGWSRTPITRSKDYRAWNWLAAAYGAKATCHWCYLEESTGPEAGCFGLVRANGQMTERAAAAAHTARLLREHAALLQAWQPEPEVGILYDPDNSMQLFAMDNGDERYVQSHIGYYRSIWKADVFARFVTYDTLEDLSGLKVLIAPMVLTLPGRVADAIARFVETGGVFVAEARTGLFDHRGYNQPILPSGGLDRVVGAVEQEALYSDPDNRPLLNNPRGDPWPEAVYAGPEIRFSQPVQVAVRARSYFVPLEVKGGEPIGSYEGQCLAVRHRYGKGLTYYFGTYLGLGLADHDIGAEAVIGKILMDHTRPQVKGRHLRPRLIRRGDEAVLAVFNDSRSLRLTEPIQLPSGFSRAIDLYSGQVLAIAEGALTVEVEAEDARVIRLST